MPDSRQDPQTDASSIVTVPVPSRADSRDAWESLFVASLPTIDSVVAALARRRRLSADAAADLASTVRLRMMVDDYAVLRKFQGRSSLKTYLTVVIHRVYLDERIATLGKWRPSTRARREGPTAVLFERLTVRDGLTFEGACAALEFNHRLPIERTALERLHSRVRCSPPRRFIPLDGGVEEIPSRADPPDERLDMAERVALAERARAALARAVASLTLQDRRILQLRFACGFSIADIARTLRLNQKTLYVRCGHLLKTLRVHLENDNLVGREVLKIIGRTDDNVFPGEGSGVAAG